jgi:hypothetical protein
VVALAWVSLIGAALGVLIRGLRHDWLTGDTKALVTGLPAITRCLGAGRLTSCNRLPAVASNGVSKFPLLQTIPALVLRQISQRIGVVIDGLALANALVVVAFFAVVAYWSYRRAGTGLAVVALFLLVPGMLTAYTAQSFGEPLAAAAFGLVVLCALRRDRPSPWLIPAAIAATVSKEVAAPLVILFGVAAIAASNGSRSTMRRSSINLVAGTVIGLILNAAFNVFRYGTLLNHVYLSEGSARTENVPINAIGMLVAPNAGLLWFWPGAIAAVAVLAIAAGRERIPRPTRIGAVIGLVAFIVAVLSCATWWDPFGWYAWGPRLMLPGATATVTLAIGMITRADLRRRWFTPLGMGLTAIVAFGVLLPTVGSVFYGGSTQSDSIIATWATRPECRPVTRLPSGLNDSCTTTEAWRLSSLPLTHSIPGIAQPTYWLTMLCVAVAIGSWLAIGRAAVLRPAPGDPATPAVRPSENLSAMSSD